MLAQAERLDDRFWLAVALWKNAIEFRLMGEWTLARDYSGRGLEVSPQDPALLIDQVMLEFQTGNLVEAEDYLDRLVGALRPAKLKIVSKCESRYGDFTGCPHFSRVWTITGGRSGGPSGASLASGFANIALRARIGLAIQANLRRDIQAAGEEYSALTPCRT